MEPRNHKMVLGSTPTCFRFAVLDVIPRSIERRFPKAGGDHRAVGEGRSGSGYEAVLFRG